MIRSRGRQKYLPIILSAKNLLIKKQHQRCMWHRGYFHLLSSTFIHLHPCSSMFIHFRLLSSTFTLSHNFHTTFIISHFQTTFTQFPHFHVTFTPISHFHTFTPFSNFHTFTPFSHFCPLTTRVCAFGLFQITIFDHKWVGCRKDGPLNASLRC